MVHIKRLQESGNDVIAIIGEIDASSSIELDLTIAKSVGEGFSKILIDCSALEYISSAGLGVFMSYIEEFKDKDTLNYTDLELFYNRVKNSPNIFLTSLVSFVFQDIYTFTYDRISEMAKSLALRMDKKDAIEFSEELLKLYE